MIKLKNNNKNNFWNIKIQGGNHIKIGKCIKIKNSRKIFQIVGLNYKKNICWVREWPLKNSSYETFELSVNNILLPHIFRLKKITRD